MSRFRLFVISLLVILLAVTAGCTLFGKTAPLTSNSTPATLVLAEPTDTLCKPGLEYCTNDKLCHNLTADINNCGGCGNTCPASGYCLYGECQCHAGYEATNGVCTRITLGPVDTTLIGEVTDTSSEVSDVGANGCPDNLDPCADRYCHDLTSDAKNCGVCGNTCGSGMVCEDYTCTNPSSSSNMEYDENTTILSNSNPVQIPVANGTCPLHYTACPDKLCHDLTADQDNCGLCGNACASGLACSVSQCTNPGSPISATPTMTVPIPVRTTQKAG